MKRIEIVHALFVRLGFIPQCLDDFRLCFDGVFIAEFLGVLQFFVLDIGGDPHSGGAQDHGGGCQNGDPGGHTAAHNGARSSQPAGNAGSAQSHDRTAEEEGSKTGNTADAHTQGTGQHFGNGRLGDRKSVV